MSAKTLLIDTFTFTPIQALEEAVVDGKKVLVYEGRVQFADKPNQNNRVYPRSLWEKVLRDPKIQESLREKRMLGTLDHPADGKTTLENASHVITGLQIKEDGEITGRIQILNTPKGQVLKALCEDGIPWGASSRGNGSLKDGPNGVKFVQDDFQFETIDAVYNPSTFGAYPQPVMESVEHNKELTEETMSIAEKFSELEAKANAVQTKGLNAYGKSVVRKDITNLMVEASKLGSEAPELAQLTEGIVRDLSQKRTALLEEAVPVGSPAEQGITSLVTDNAAGQADTGFLRRVPKEPLPPEGDGGHVVDPSAVAVPSPMEAALLALVNEEKGDGDKKAYWKKKKKYAEERMNEEKEEDSSSEEDGEFMKEEKESSSSEDDEKEDQMESYARGIANNTKLPKSTRALAAYGIFEAKRRINEAEAYKRIIGKMQEKLDEAINSGSIVVETDDTLAAKYQLSQDVLKEVVRRYHINEAKTYAVDRLIETGLDQDDKAVKFLGEAIKSMPVVTKSTIEEALLLFGKVSGFDLSKEPRPKSEVPVPVTESKESVKSTLTETAIPGQAKKELPLTDLSGKIAKLNETKEVSPSISLANRLSESLAISRPKNR